MQPQAVFFSDEWQYWIKHAHVKPFSPPFWLKFYFIFVSRVWMTICEFFWLTTPYNIAQQSWIQQLWMTESLQTKGNSYPESAGCLVSGWLPGETLWSLRATTRWPRSLWTLGTRLRHQQQFFYFTIPPTGRNIKSSSKQTVYDLLPVYVGSTEWSNRFDT